jgi:hypothetical protein
MTEELEHRTKLRFLLRSAAALASTSVVTAGLGFVYWAFAARVFPATNVGEASTAIAAMNLIAPLALLGLGTLLIAELPPMTDGRSTLVSTAGLLTGLAAGAVDQVFPVAELNAAAQALVVRLCGSAPASLAAIKRLSQDGPSLSLQAYLSLEQQLLKACARTADAREGTSAFMAKRQPQFTGH